MEILKGHSASIKFTVPSDLTSATYTVDKNGVQVGSSKNAEVVNGVATAKLPYSVTLSDAKISVNLRFNYESEVFNLTKKIRVSTPYIDLWEIKEILETQDDEEATTVERAVRNNINAHCGQQFNTYDGVLQGRGGGSSRIDLPDRLRTLRTVNGYDGSNYEIDAGGWIVRPRGFGIPSVKSDAYGYHMHTGGVIHNPNNVRLDVYPRSKTVDIDGIWGWEEVPTAVTEAMKLLVEDYACQEATYRDRYIANMTAADWRFEFNEGAFSRTGNVRADQMLEEFVVQRGWVLI